MTKRSNAWVLLSLATVVTLSLAGCGESTGTVKGTVYLSDKVVTAGSVAFHAANNKVATAQIQSDGMYQAAAVGTGLAKVTVHGVPSVPAPKKGMDMDPAKMGGASDKGKIDAPPVGKSVNIPTKYSDPASSGVTFEVKSGINDFDIKLP